MENFRGSSIASNYNSDFDFEIHINNKEFASIKNQFIIEISFTSSEVLKKMLEVKDFYFAQFHERDGESLVFSYLNNFDINILKLILN